MLKIHTSNMKDVYYTPDQVQQADFLGHIDKSVQTARRKTCSFRCWWTGAWTLLRPLSTETIDGKTVFFVDGNVLAACFDAASAKTS